MFKSFRFSPNFKFLVFKSSKYKAYFFFSFLQSDTFLYYKKKLSAFFILKMYMIFFKTRKCLVFVYKPLRMFCLISLETFPMLWVLDYADKK